VSIIRGTTLRSSVGSENSRRAGTVGERVADHPLADARDSEPFGAENLHAPWVRPGASRTVLSLSRIGRYQELFFAGLLCPADTGHNQEHLHSSKPEKERVTRMPLGNSGAKGLIKGKGIYNLVVIGGGTAGLVTAAGTAALGGRVALIERHKMGGDCLNYGCVPSKALIASARALHIMRSASALGLPPVKPESDFTQVFQRMRARRARLAPNDSQERFEALGVDVFRGNAAFVSPYDVEADGQRLRGKYFVIATGSRAEIPEVHGLKTVPYFTNETIFDNLNERPSSLLIIGGGPMGCELSQVFQRLGVQVTLVHHGSHLLSREDPDVAAFVEKRLKSEGIRVLYCSDIKSVARWNDSFRAEIAPKPTCKADKAIDVTAGAILVAAGRVPNIEGLGLEAAGIRFSGRGIEVNQYLQTSQPHVYAAGDVIGTYQFTHVADFHARTVIRNTLMPFFKTKMDYSVVPWCTYVDPEVARVGLNETEAQDQGTEYDLFKLPLAEVDRAVVSDEDAGFIKIITRKGRDRILGVTMVASHGGDLIHEFVLAMKHGIGLRKIAGTIHAYPTFAEAARKLGDQFNRTRLTPLVKNVFAWLYRRSRE
jgi:pyruvate/2-oxoglutarate dehydrogenase complex dihydrolipoamide dehydrogenase (E3) component